MIFLWGRQNQSYKNYPNFFFSLSFYKYTKEISTGKKTKLLKNIQEKHVICLHLHFQRPRVNNHKMNSQHQPQFILCHRDLCFSVRLKPSFLLHSHPKKSVWQVWLKVVRRIHLPQSNTGVHVEFSTLLKKFSRKWKTHLPADTNQIKCSLGALKLNLIFFVFQLCFTLRCGWGTETFTVCLKWLVAATKTSGNGFSILAFS